MESTIIYTSPGHYDPLEIVLTYYIYENKKIKKLYLTFKQYITDTGRRWWDDEQVLKNKESKIIKSKEELIILLEKYGLNKVEMNEVATNIFNLLPKQI